MMTASGVLVRSARAVWLSGMLCLHAAEAAADGNSLNPGTGVASADGRRLFLPLAGAGAIAVVDVAEGRLVATWPLGGAPTGLARHVDGNLLATIGDGTGEVRCLRATDGRTLARFPVGGSPLAPVVLENGNVLAVAHRFPGEVAWHRLPHGELIARVPVTREPIAMALAAGGRRLFVANHLPAQPATAPHVAAVVDVIDPARRHREAPILLPNGATSVRGMAATPDGRHVVVTHVLGHHQVPANQLERGWMNANAISVIDAHADRLLATVLLDDTDRGAANPWGVAVSPDGRTLAVAHAGTHELSVIPVPGLLAVIAGAKDPRDLERDLTSMVRVGRVRVPLPGQGPRGVVFAGSTVAVAQYFSGEVVLGETTGPPRLRAVALGEEPAITPEREGERLFHDATHCFQGWQSCATCHPDARADALNWDLLNDGVGNPKQTKSLLFSPATPPVMGHGVRADAATAVRAGFRFIQFHAVSDDEARAVEAYLRSLRPLVSAEPAGSAAAIRGREVFDRLGCETCHSGPLGTDLALHQISHATGADAERPFDTPTLSELWRTAPYLYDGRAATLAEALRIKSPAAAALPPAELADLVAYLRTR